MNRAAASAFDGGMVIDSARVMAYRVDMVFRAWFLDDFVTERFGYGLLGPLDSGYGDFFRRWFENRGWNMAFQVSESACAFESEDGCESVWHFAKQSLYRRVITVRCILQSLLADRTVWSSRPWSVYALHMSLLFDFGLLIDLALFYLQAHARLPVYPSSPSGRSVAQLFIWMFGLRLVTVLPHFARNRYDFGYLLAIIGAGYLFYLSLRAFDASMTAQ